MNWFYHAPGRGRMGPVSADELRGLYRDRAIDRDTLVWREGLREWQPLERLAEELDLHAIVPDATRPPPLPPGAPPGSAPAAPTRMARPASEKKPLGGCLIALIVAVVFAVAMVGILAAIALPQYHDYVQRSQVLTYVQPRAAALQAGIERSKAEHGQCPGDPAEAGLSAEAAEGVHLGTTDDGQCAFVLMLAGVDPKIDGRSIEYIAQADGTWDCSGGDLPARYRPAACRATTSE